MSGLDPCPQNGSAAIIELFKRDVDRTLLQSRVPMSVDDRFVDLGRSQSLVREFDTVRTAQPRPMTDLPHMIRLLALHRIDFIVVGGMAGIAHGAGRVTFDIDCVYARDPETIARLAAVMTRFQPTLRGAPPGLPFRFDAATITAGLNFTTDYVGSNFVTVTAVPEPGTLVLVAAAAGLAAILRRRRA